MRPTITSGSIPRAVRRRFLEDAKVLSWLFLMVIVSGCVALGTKACSRFVPRPGPDLSDVLSGLDQTNPVIGEMPVPISARRVNKRKS